MFDIEIMADYAEKYGENALYRVVFLWPVVYAVTMFLVLWLVL